MRERLQRHAETFRQIRWFASWQEWLSTAKFIAPSTTSPAPQFPTTTQASIVRAMVNESSATHLLLADRGRGKSTTLGLAIQQFAQLNQRSIVVTGPHPQAVATLLAHTEGQQRVSFIAWDQLLKRNLNPDTLVVIDEAAALPLHVTQQLCNRFQVWALASTVDGYEGCGKGFAQRFKQWLFEHCEVQQHSLTTPLRWAEDDNCEAWLNAALLLRSAPAEQLVTAPKQQYQWQWCHAQELNEYQLQAVMSLLLEAHYQSSPNDLRLLLDDASQHLCLLWHQKQLIGVCWLANEAPIAESLRAAVLAGKRRLKGRLLPQAIGFYRQQPGGLIWRWQRIVRIAVQPQLQRHGLGTALLQQVTARARAQGFTALGTSFGASPKVLAFWQHTALIEVRRGTKRNMASGEVNALFALGLTEQSQSLLTALAQLHLAEQAWHRSKPVAIAKPLLQQTILPLLRGFTQSYLPFSNIRFAWWYVLTHYAVTVSAVSPEALLPTTTYAELLQTARVASRAEFEQKIRTEVLTWLEEISLTDIS